MVSRVLVIKLGALGDFIQACGPFQAIRRYHTNAHITLLTTSRFSSLARNSGWFDEVWIDDQGLTVSTIYRHRIARVGIFVSFHGNKPGLAGRRYHGL